MKKALFFDIDGTLIDCNHDIYSIPTSTRESLDTLKNNGNKVFLATGRCECFITPGVYDYQFDGYVTCNGGYVKFQDKTIFKAVIPSDAIKATMDLAKDLDINYYFESNDYIYIKDGLDQDHIEFAKNWGMKPETLIDDFDYQEIETYIGMIVLKDINDIPEMVDRLSPYFDVQRHQSDNSFDLTLRGTSKGLGITKLIEYLQLDIDKTIAFGDGRNDLEMLEAVGTGVAMGNAVIEAKEVADEVCDNVMNDGITSWLKDKGLI